MIQSSGERYVDARCEQVWMVIDDANCLARWLSNADEIAGVTTWEPAKRVEWSTVERRPSTDPRFEETSAMTVELIPEGAGTRVRIVATQETVGTLRGLITRFTHQRSVDRHINQSLDQLVELLRGRTAA
jgi:carbon monoxide dehydrogenase subunit G